MSTETSMFFKVAFLDAYHKMVGHFVLLELQSDMQNSWYNLLKELPPRVGIHQNYPWSNARYLVVDNKGDVLEVFSMRPSTVFELFNHDGIVTVWVTCTYQPIPCVVTAKETVSVQQLESVDSSSESSKQLELNMMEKISSSLQIVSDHCAKKMHDSLKGMLRTLDEFMVTFDEHPVVLEIRKSHVDVAKHLETMMKKIQEMNAYDINDKFFKDNQISLTEEIGKSLHRIQKCTKDLEPVLNSIQEGMSAIYIKQQYIQDDIESIKDEFSALDMDLLEGKTKKKKNLSMNGSGASAVFPDDEAEIVDEKKNEDENALLENDDPSESSRDRLHRNPRASISTPISYYCDNDISWTSSDS